MTAWTHEGATAWTALVAALGASPAPRRIGLELVGRGTTVLCDQVRTSTDPSDQTVKLYAHVVTGGERMVGTTERPAEAWDAVTVLDEVPRAPGDEDTDDEPGTETNQEDQQ